MNQDELNEVLRKHKLWLEDEEGGRYANLSYTNLSYAHLRGANLSDANLRGAENIPDYVFAGTTIAAEGDLIV